MKEIDRPLSKNIDTKSIGEIVVANIQKLETRLDEAKNDYNAKIQRVFFIDEAHRSYKSTGEYFKNLMTCDLDAVYIALTGTPLLTKKERSNLKFGDYIHKYFYDKSIADGYTLRIKKENIDTVAKSEIKKNLDIEDSKLDDKDVYESDAYVACLGAFIERDFRNFRLQNSDNTIGGMIVCRTNPQARKVHEWFKANSKLSTGLVITDVNDPAQAQINKNNQIDFRDTLAPDILVVNFMLTTGYDVKRLKKMYLLRGPHAQSLLQTISRVNRPYKSPTGKVYKYGYIVDFVDIEKEYDNTIDAYIKELEADLNENGENEGSLAGLVIDKEDINKKYHKYVDDLDDIIDTDNLEKFSKRLTQYNKETLLKIRRLLNGIKECETEFILSRATDYAKQIDHDKNQKLLRSVQERIDFINLTSKPVDMMNVISNDEVITILYDFIKTAIMILDLGKFTADDPAYKRFEKTVRAVHDEIQKNKNKDDIKVVKLDQLLQDIFNKLSISDLSDLDAITDELLEALKKAQEINDENERLASQYGNNYAFVKTYQDAVCDYTVVDQSVIEGTLVIVYENVKDPHKAKVAENSVTKAKVDSKKKATEQKYQELQEQISEQEKAKKLVEEKHAVVEKANTEVTTLSERLDSRKKNLVEGVATAEKLEEEIAKLQTSIEEYEELKQELLAAEKSAKDAYLESKTKIGSAEKETKAADKSHKEAEKALEKALKDNKFESRDDAEELMLDNEEIEDLSSQIATYDASVKTAKENLKSIKTELKGKKEPDEEKCQEILDNASDAQGEYREKKGILSKEIERLDKKVKSLKKEGKGIEEKIREAEEDFAFAKKLRGDSGTGLQRYVLGIMFSSVVTAANKMLEMVHGGRYRLYRSDEKAQGTNKRGLELKVFDKNSEEHDGRFVSTLSGGEKFLASLALSIGMSTVAQKSGIKIEALFIDEGFGSLDDDSIGDAMNVLNSIQEANGLVGIISHVQILQDQIPSKLRVEEDKRGSHIVQTVG